MLSPVLSSLSLSLSLAFLRANVIVLFIYLSMYVCMYVRIYSFFATWRCFSAQDYRRRASIAITEKDLYLVLLGARVKLWTNQSLYLVDEVLDWLAQVIVGMWGV